LTREDRFNRLHEEHFEAVRRYVWRREPADVDDVIAETFLVAWRRLDDVPQDARPWLIGVARNIRLNARRSARRRQALASRLSEAPSAEGVAEPGAGSEAARAALAQLSEQDREVLLLSIWDDLDRSAIADALGCSKANVSVRLHRARRRFAHALTGPRPGSEHSRSPMKGGAADVR
jgi:RNA polymerase sigma factor (sigma-70 family)